MRIGIVAPSCPLGPEVPARLEAIANHHFGAHAPEFIVHPQCFRKSGHFAGPDQQREDVFVDMANDPSLDAIWFARGGYGACRIAQPAIKRLGEAARAKAYLGYSDAGFILAGLYARGIGRVAHGPMPADLLREGGDAAIVRALSWLIGNVVTPDVSEEPPRLNLSPPLFRAATKHAAFNLTVLSQLLGTSLEPDLTDHVLMIEEVSEYMYRIDRSLFHLTSQPSIRAVAGIKLGRCSQIPVNDVDFGMDEVALIEQWCAVSGIAYLGRADIGHDAANKVIPFG
jgi:muramoyltetrapeptide carboxypeptidase